MNERMKKAQAKFMNERPTYRQREVRNKLLTAQWEIEGAAKYIDGRTAVGKMVRDLAKQAKAVQEAYWAELYPGDAAGQPGMPEKPKHAAGCRGFVGGYDCCECGAEQ